MGFDQFGGPEAFVAMLLTWILNQITIVQAKRLACYEVQGATKETPEMARYVAEENAYEKVLKQIAGLLEVGDCYLLSDAISDRYDK